MEIHLSQVEAKKDDLGEVEGFPLLAAQLRYEIRTGMVVHLEDFYFRRIPLFASRFDHGLPWAEKLAKIWAEERGLSLSGPEMQIDVQKLRQECAGREAWKLS